MLLGEAPRVEEVRRKTGDRGDFPPPAACKEPKDVRLCNVGVTGRSLLRSDAELGALRNEGFVFREESAVVLGTIGAAVDEAIGDEGGRFVAAGVDSIGSDPLTLFIDRDKCSGSGLFVSIVLDICTGMPLPRAAYEIRVCDAILVSTRTRVPR